MRVCLKGFVERIKYSIVHDSDTTSSVIMDLRYGL